MQCDSHFTFSESMKTRRVRGISCVNITSLCPRVNLIVHHTLHATGMLCTLYWKQEYVLWDCVSFVIVRESFIVPGNSHPFKGINRASANECFPTRGPCREFNNTAGAYSPVTFPFLHARGLMRASNFLPTKRVHAWC